MKPHAARPEWQVWLLWLGLLAGVAFFSRPALPLDETRYLAVAWEMWQRGDFLVPFKNGVAYSDKPPLLFWLIHLGWFVAGINEWWPRFITPLLSLASTWMTWRLARRLWPDAPATARLAPLVLLSCFLWLLYSQALMFDVLIAACALIGLNALVEAALTEKRRCWALFGLSVGLGVLAKGPAILVHLLPAALLAPLWAKRLKPDILWSRWYAGVGLGLLLGVALALAWAIPAGLHGGETYRHAIFWGQTADRMVKSFAHQRPFWWYLATLPVFLFPWLFWPRLIATLAKTLRADIDDAGVRFSLIWFATAFLIFSFISGKQPHYVLPEFPAAALLIAHALTRNPPAGRPWLPALTFAGLGMALLTASQVAHLPASLHWMSVLPIWAGIPFILAGLLAWGDAKTSSTTPQRLAWAMLLAILSLLFALFRPLAAENDTHVIGQALARYQALGQPTAHGGEYHAQFNFSGRLMHPLSVVAATEIPAWLEQHPNGVAVIYFDDARNLAPYYPLAVQPYRGSTALLVDHRAITAIQAKPLLAPAESAGD
jgi:4-amino-4-deoxy-L-arabinose transferase-like glycosyltransferase